MKTRRPFAVSIAAALTGFAGHSAIAQEDLVKAMTSPDEKSIEFGVTGAVDEPNAAGKFTGLSETDALPIFNGTYVTREEETGTWLRIEGSNLGLDTRSVRLEYERQGDWEYFLDFDQITKNNPLNIFTSLTGIDSNEQNRTGTARREVDFATDRYNVRIGAGKRFGKKYDVKLSYRTERKDGERPFGSQGFDFFSEPIDRWHHELDARVNYVGQDLQVTGGFLGSVFVNEHKSITDVATNNGDQDTLSLPMDNQAYKVYLSGGYALAPKTRATFKASYNLMLQDEEFLTTLTPGDTQRPGTGTDLGGEVHNYLAQVGLSSRPIRGLSLRAKARYEGRHDDTPVRQFIGSSATRDGNNNPYTREQINVSADATYRLPMAFYLTGLFKYEDTTRTFPNLRQISWREDNDEYTVGAKLRRTLTETLGGVVGYSFSERDGSDFLPNGFGNTRIDPIHWGDRDRHKLSVNADWAPMEQLSFQARVDGTYDAYNALALGPRDGSSNNAAIDAVYMLTPDWSLTAFVSRNEVFRDQATFDGSQSWAAELTHLGYSGGIGVRGRPMEGLKVGADLQYAYDKSEYDLDPIGGPAIADLPDIAYRQFDFGMFADYALSDNGSVKFRYGFTHLENSDFTWDGVLYTDGTFIQIPDQEDVHFLGLSYTYRW